MSLTETVMEGTIQPDGTLVLDEPTKLPAGRVKVVLRQEAEPKPPQPLGEEFFQMMEEIWAARQQAGLQPHSVEEVEAERRRFRDEVDEEIAEAGRLQDECRRLRQEAEQSNPEAQ